MPGHPVRSCIACGQEDDHPRHGIYMGPDLGHVLWHMDCHSHATGCDTCNAQIADAGGVKGDELRTHLLSLAKE